MEKEKHYLEEIILNGGNGSDMKIIEEVKKRLPEGCMVNSDDTFLIVECENSERYSNNKVAKMINMPIKSISYTTLKRCDGYNNKLIYFCWDKFIDILGFLS